MNDWEKHEQVQAFLNNDDPTLEEYANAYYIRDTNGFNFTFEQVKKKAIKYLYLNTNTLKNAVHDYVSQQVDEMTIDLPYEQYIKDNVETINISLPDISFPCADIIKRINENNKKYQHLQSITDHKEFYRNLTKSDFIMLGW